MGSIEQSPTVRLTTLRVLAGLFAVSSVVLPGFGAIDLSVTWSSDWPQVLEAGWGLYATVLVGAAFALVAVRPRRSRPAVAQLVVATVALAVSAPAADEPRAPLARRGPGSPDRDRRCVVRSRLGRSAGEPRPGLERPARPGRARAGPVARLRPRHVGAEPRGPLRQRRDPRDRPLLGAGGGRPRARPVAAAGGAASRRSPVRGRVRRDRRRVPRDRVLRLARCRGRLLSGMVVRRDRLGPRPRPRRPRTVSSTVAASSARRVLAA